MRLRGSVEKRLSETRAEVQRLRETRRVLDEQVAFCQEVADEAETRALVAATPLADREFREAADDLRRARRQRDEVVSRIEGLTAEQDQLLDRLMGGGA